MGQELIWTLEYPATSNEPALTKIDDNHYALTGQLFKLPEGWNIFTDFYTEDGRLINKILWGSSRFEKPGVIFQSIFRDSLLYLAFNNGRLVSINTHSYDVDSSHSNILSCLINKNETINLVFKNGENLFFFGYSYKSKCVFEIHYNTEHKTFTYCQPCVNYPQNAILNLLKDGSIIATKVKYGKTYVEKINSHTNKILFSIPLDSLYFGIEHLHSFETISGDIILYYRIESMNRWYSRIMRIGPSGNLIWSHYLTPEPAQSLFETSIKYYNTLIETPLEELILGGTEGVIDVGHRGKYLLSKYSKNGELIWESTTELGWENDAIFTMAMNKYRDVLIAGVADLTDFETPNKIFFTKIKSQKFRDSTGKYENIVIYPNPFLNDLVVYIPHAHKPPFKIEIFDIYGRTILDETQNKFMICLNIKEAQTKTLILKVTESGAKVHLEQLLIKL